MTERKIRFLLCVIVLSLIPGLLFADINGKIVGQVVDKENGEVLPGANIVVEGTTLGAAANIKGEFVILNVPPGNYRVKATFIGYTPVTLKEVRVHSDLTTELDFELPVESIEVGEVSITATRPMVNKSATNTHRIKTAEEIEVLPIRGFRDVISLESGVTRVGARIYVRGGRREEIATYVDGVYQNNPLTGRAGGDISNSAIEEVNFQTGGFNAEYGFANSGVIQTITKTGGSRYDIMGEVITDSWLSQTDKFLDTYSYGYNVYNMSIGGPLPFFGNKVKFFLNAEKRYLQDSNPSGFAFNKLITDENGNPLDANGLPITFADTSAAAQYGWNTEDAFPGTDGTYRRFQWDEQGPWPDHSSNQWLWQGNITVDLNPILIRFGGNSHRFNDRQFAGYSPGADYQNVLNGAGIGFALWNSDNHPRWEQWIDSYYFKVTHTLGAKTYYTAQVNYFRDKNELSSVMFGDQVWNYGDAPGTDVGRYGTEGDGITNPYIDQTGTRPHLEPRGANLFSSYGTQPGRYLKRDWQFVGVKADLTHQIGRTHEIKTGLEYRYNTYRSYDIGGYGAADLHALSQSLAQVGSTFTPYQAYQIRFADPFGYDLFGNKADEGRNAAKHPVIAALYLQDKIELDDLIINIGLRWDYFDPAYERVRDVEQVTTETRENNIVDLKEENFVGNDTWTSFSPRLGFSFPVTDKVIFHAQYGKFYQTPELLRLYSSTYNYAFSLQSGNFFAQNNPNLEGVRTTAYEVGFRQQLSDRAAFDITAYYKEIRNQVRLTNLDFAQPIPYALYLNQDYGTVKGLSFSFNLRRTNKISATLNYTLQYAAGTGSDANTLYNTAWQSGRTPTYVAPLDYDQRHTASFDIDYRNQENDGPALFGIKPLENAGANVLFTMGSGLSYTPVRIQTEVLGGTSGYFPIGQVGSAYSPWTFQMDLKLDKTFQFSNLRFNAYLWVINVLDHLNANWVYPGTGEADNDGYLATPAGQNFVQTWGENGVDLYNFLLQTPHMAGPPRQIRLGVRFEL